MPEAMMPAADDVAACHASHRHADEGAAGGEKLEILENFRNVAAARGQPVAAVAGSPLLGAT
jgi:hypothetical protein